MIGVPSFRTTSKLKPHKLLYLSCLDIARIPQKKAELYAAGHSVHEISEKLHRSRERIRAILEAEKLLSPATAKEITRVEKVLRGKVRWNSPYGFMYEKGPSR